MQTVANISFLFEFFASMSRTGKEQYVLIDQDDNIATKQGGGIYLPAPLHGHPASLIVNTEIIVNPSTFG